MFFFTLKVVSFSNLFQCRRSGNRLWGLFSFVKQIYTCLISLAENGGGSLVQEYLWKVVHHRSVTNQIHNKFAPKWRRTCGWGSRRFGCARSRGILMPVPWGGRVPPCFLQKIVERNTGQIILKLPPLLYLVATSLSPLPIHLWRIGVWVNIFNSWQIWELQINNIHVFHECILGLATFAYFLVR